MSNIRCSLCHRMSHPDAMTTDQNTDLPICPVCEEIHGEVMSEWHIQDELDNPNTLFLGDRYV